MKLELTNEEATILFFAAKHHYYALEQIKNDEAIEKIRETLWNLQVDLSQALKEYFSEIDPTDYESNNHSS